MAYSRFRERIGESTPVGPFTLGKLERLNSDMTAVVQTIEVTNSLSPGLTSVDRCLDQKNKPRKTRISTGSVIKYTDGGPFLATKVRLPSNDVSQPRLYKANPNASQKWQYTGSFGLGGWPAAQDYTEDQYKAAGRTPGDVTIPIIDTLGPQAYALLRPNLEKAGLAVALRELRDLPRMLKTTAKGFHDLWRSAGGDASSVVMGPKKAADHFLNHNFGWVPFLSDVNKLLDVYQHSHRYIGKISSQNGQWVRRKRVIEELETDTRITRGWTSYLLPGGFHIDTMTSAVNFDGTNSRYYHELRELVHTRTWAEGLFRYYRPEFDVDNPTYHSAAGAIQRQLTVYGLRITPSNIYKSTPWTWLGDWLSNAGDHVTLVNDQLVDSVASQYMYLMHHRIRRRVLRQTINFVHGAQTFEFQKYIETKQRHRAGSPYGFTLSGSLTSRQYSILAALGISRYL